MRKNFDIKEDDLRQRCQKLEKHELSECLVLLSINSITTKLQDLRDYKIAMSHNNGF